MPGFYGYRRTSRDRRIIKYSRPDEIIRLASNDKYANSYAYPSMMITNFKAFSAMQAELQKSVNSNNYNPLGRDRVYP